MTTETRTYRYEQIAFSDLPPDLRDEIESYTDDGTHPIEAIAYQITIYDETGTIQEPERARALYLPRDGRLGIAWGADATWADVPSLEAGIEMYLNDGDEWEARN